MGGDSGWEWRGDLGESSMEAVYWGESIGDGVSAVYVPPSLAEDDGGARPVTRRVLSVHHQQSVFRLAQPRFPQAQEAAEAGNSVINGRRCSATSRMGL